MISVGKMKMVSCNVSVETVDEMKIRGELAANQSEPVTVAEEQL